MTLNGRKNRLFNKWDQNNWISTCKRMNPDVYLTAYREINLKCVNDLNINLSEGKIGINFHDIRLGLKYDTKSKNNKIKIKCTLSKLKTFMDQRTLSRK